MWGYYNGNAMSVSELYIFETKKETSTIIKSESNKEVFYVRTNNGSKSMV